MTKCLQPEIMKLIDIARDLQYVTKNLRKASHQYEIEAKLRMAQTELLDFLFRRLFDE